MKATYLLQQKTRKAELSCATLRIKLTFDGRQPLMEDNLGWKTIFDGKQPLMEDDL